MANPENMTEEYALEQEQLYIARCRTVAQNYPTFKERVSTLIKAHTSEAYHSLINMYNDQEMFELFKNEPEYAYMNIIIQIYNAEQTAGRTNTILDVADNISDYVQLLQKAKHILWRIEFTDDNDAIELMLHFIKAYNISPFFILELLKTSALTQEIYMKLVDIFDTRHMISYEYYILKLLNEIHPGNENILCLLITLTMQIGRPDIANEYLSQIKEPGNMTERIRKKYGL